MFRPIASALVLVLLPISAYSADKACAPPAVLKIVTAEEIEGTHRGDFLTAPRTLYRMGEKAGRLEQAKNARTGSQLLLVVNEPDIWVANLAKGQGRHVVDAGPSLKFRAHVIDNASAVKSEFIRTLEYGCEVQWMRDAGAKPLKIHHATLGRVNKLEYSEGDEHLVLYERDGKPLRLRLLNRDRQIVAMNYLRYETVKSVDPALFAEPQGIAFAVDAPASPATQEGEARGGTK